MAKMEAWQSQTLEIIDLALQKSDQIRQLAFQKLEKSFFFFDHSKLGDIPITSDEQALGLEEFNAKIQEATLDVLKLGKTEKLALLDKQKDNTGKVVEMQVYWTKQE
jgi:hypothetical protein